MNQSPKSNLAPEFELRAHEELARLDQELQSLDLKLTNLGAERERLVEQVESLKRLLGQEAEPHAADELQPASPIAPLNETKSVDRASGPTPVREANRDSDAAPSPRLRRLKVQFDRRGYRRRGSALSAAYETLREAQQPLHYTELTKRMLDSGKWTTSGDTPERSVNSLVSMDIVSNGEESPFERYDRGVYALREWKKGTEE